MHYSANPIDFEATFERALNNGLRVRHGGGRPEKSGEPANAQIIFDLQDIDSKITVSRTGKVEIYYPSRPNLKRCIEIVMQYCVPVKGELGLHCESWIDPLDLAVEYTITENWKGTELRCVVAKVDVHQWLDVGTGAYIFRLPDSTGRLSWPEGNCVYQGYCTTSIMAVDKDDEHGNRVVTAERLVWQGLRELKRVVREHPRVKFQDGRAVDA